MDERQPHKRKGDFPAMASRKTPKLSASGGSAKMTFAQRMMAKMGHVEGQGLGKAGEGIINPIEVKLRPQGAGVGAVREKTEQYKQEQRRAAEARGEEFEDSSEEERRARRKRKEKSRTAGASTGGAGAVGATSKKKAKYRTVEEVQAAAPGLALPRAMLGSIVDATGSETKLLTSTAGLMGSAMVKAETEEDKIKKRERTDIEAYIEAWHGLQERKVHLEEHEGQLQVELGQMQEDIAKLDSIVNSLTVLRVSEASTADTQESSWTMTVAHLLKLQEEHQHEIDSCGLSEAAIAILAPLFKDEIDDWQVLEEPQRIIRDLTSLRLILGVKSDSAMTANGDFDPELRKYRKQKATNPFETLLYRIWLPKMRATITGWDYRKPDGMVLLIQSWRPLLPPFILSNIIDQLVVPKFIEGLKSAISATKHSKKGNSLSLASVQAWLFPWLPHLPTYQMDARSSTGLMSEVKRLVRHILSTCDLTAGPFPGLASWTSILQGEMPHLLVKHLLPRLAAYMSLHFEVDPSDQQLTALEAVFKWRNLFKPEVFARLLAAEFFPKVLAVLYDWITGAEADMNEIYPWLAWWKTVIPKELQSESDTIAGWASAQKMIDDALAVIENGGDVSMDLSRPAAGAARPLAKEASAKKARHEERTETGARLHAAEPSFKDLVDEWCADHDLTMLPLREAHPRNGKPLFRITASATGKGGAVVYFDDNLVFAQRKGQRETYDVFGLEGTLLKRVEGE